MSEQLHCQAVVASDGVLCSVHHLVEQAQRKLYTAVVLTCCLTHLESVLWLPVSHTTELFMHSNALFWLPIRLKQLSVLFQVL